MKSHKVSSGHSIDGIVLEPEQRDFSGNIKGLRTTASNRINSCTFLDRVDDNRGNFVVRLERTRYRANTTLPSS